MYRRMTVAEAELPVLRRAAGYLVVGDDRYVYGKEVKYYEPFTWKWRLYLPTGRHFVVKIASGEIPPDGLPTIKPYEYSVNIEGEMAISANIRPLENNIWQMILDYKDEKLDFAQGIYYSAKSLSCSASAQIDASVMDKITQAKTYQSFVFGSDAVEAREPEKPVVLLRVRSMKNDGNGGWIPSMDSESGLMIWLEEKK
jgi:hypothetical protein